MNTIRAGAQSMASALELTDDDAAFLSTPVASITGLVQVHLTLDRGARLILDDHFEPAASLGRLRTQQATVLGGAPIIIEELFRQAAEQDVPTLRPVSGKILRAALAAGAGSQPDGLAPRLRPG